MPTLRLVRVPRRKWLFIVLLIALVGFYIGLPAMRVAEILHPTRIKAQITPADRGLNYEDVTFTSTDGIRLVGWYIPAQNRAAVILCHGYISNRSQLLDQAAVLARQGFGVLLYDMRAHGNSGGNLFTRGWLEVNDLLGAVAYVQSRPNVDPNRIGVYGFSIGGQVAIRAAAQTDKIKAVIADGASTNNFLDEPPRVSVKEWIDYPGNWMYYVMLSWFSGVPTPPAVLDVIPTIAPRPLLLISTGQGLEQRQLRRYYDAAREPKALWEIPEAEHGGGFAVRPQQYAERMIAFFKDALLR
jgi:fermentation-respiration switch protein FrsA (DUF1100 family)